MITRSDGNAFEFQRFPTNDTESNFTQRGYIDVGGTIAYSSGAKIIRDRTWVWKKDGSVAHVTEYPYTVTDDDLAITIGYHG